MHDIPWYVALLLSVPQTIFVILFGFGLFNIKLKNQDILLLAFMVAGLCYLLRPLAFPYAVNTLILVVLLSLLSSFVSRINVRYCFNSVVLGVIICGGIESIMLPLIMKATGITLEQIIMNPWINLMAYLPIFVVTVQS